MELGARVRSLRNYPRRMSRFSTTSFLRALLALGLLLAVGCPPRNMDPGTVRMNSSADLSFLKTLSVARREPRGWRT
jgi:hypothetical protein